MLVRRLTQEHAQKFGGARTFSANLGSAKHENQNSVTGCRNEAFDAIQVSTEKSTRSDPSLLLLRVADQTHLFISNATLLEHNSVAGRSQCTVGRFGNQLDPDMVVNAQEFKELAAGEWPSE